MASRSLNPCFRAIRHVGVLLIALWAVPASQPLSAGAAGLQSSESRVLTPEAQQARLRQEEESLHRQLVQLQSVRGATLETVIVSVRLADNLADQQRHAEAMDLLQKAVALLPPSENLLMLRTQILLRKARLHRPLGQFHEATRQYDEVLALLRNRVAGRNPDREAVQCFLVALGDVADLYRDVSRFEAAQRYADEMLQVTNSERLAGLIGAIDRATARYLHGELRRRQGDLLQAKQQMEEAVGYLKQVPADQRSYIEVSIYEGMALVHYDLARAALGTDAASHWQQAEAYHSLALKAIDKLPPPDRQAPCVEVHTNQGVLYHEWAKRDTTRRDRLLGQAEEQFQSAVATLKAISQATGNQLVGLYNNLALLEWDRGNHARAEQWARKAAEAIARHGDLIDPELRRNNLFLLAQVEWAAGRLDRQRRENARQHIHQALELVEQQRSRSIGSPFQTAQYGYRLGGVEWTIVQWAAEQAAEGEPLSEAMVAEVSEAMDRCRALALQEEIRGAGKDLLDELPPDEAAPLRMERNAAEASLMDLSYREKESVSRLLHMLGGGSQAARAVAEEKSKLAAVRQQLEQARQKYEETTRRIWSRSQAGRQLQQLQTSAPFEQIQQWLSRRRILLLQYLVGDENSFLLAFGGDHVQSRLESLQLTHQQAQVLGEQPGPLGAAKLRRILLDPEQGLLQHLGNPQSQPPAERLLALGEALLPEAVRELLADHAGHDYVMIVADGPLGMLPLQVLLVPSEQGARYVIDVARPIVYAPSLRFAMQLDGKPPRAIKRALTVAKADYSDYRRDFPALGNLPHAQTESEVVKEWLQRAGIEVVQLFDGEVGDHNATEQAVRSQAADVGLIHFACHAWAEAQYGSLAGWLCLSRGQDRSLAAGPLTVPEIYRLPLSECQLVLLSACRTQRGPELQGEGVWGVARGFLVAGARRVMATTWEVDDEAGAYLIRSLCENLPEHIQAAAPDGPLLVAECLARAQQSLRWSSAQDSGRARAQWDQPYYWGPFVLIGVP